MDLVSPHCSLLTDNRGALAAHSFPTRRSSDLGGKLTWTYTVADSAVEYLAKDQTRLESFTMTLNDHDGTAVTEETDVTITGANDALVITAQGQVGAVTEQVAQGNTLSDTGDIT